MHASEWLRRCWALDSGLHARSRGVIDLLNHEHLSRQGFCPEPLNLTLIHLFPCVDGQLTPHLVFDPGQFWYRPGKDPVVELEQVGVPVLLYTYRQ